ncbi:MAG: hypothetical protein QOF76_2798 [Solirubrobacteraceae bacterium]|jgi:hypothetical protein|nr:hypothetical protein [Solirubrobacteraceae bacterium]
MLALAPPVPGPIVRPFVYSGSPFAAGLHRGVDFRAEPGAVVVSPCAGRVAWAGSGGVTLLCGGRRVTLLPLYGVRVGDGTRVSVGDPVARVALPGPLHLGVRRAGDPFGYLDPERFLRRPGSSAPPMVGPGRRRGPSPRAPAPPAGAPQPAPVDAPAGLAPWPAWVGVLFLLAAVARRRRIRRRAGLRLGDAVLDRAARRAHETVP